MSSPSVGQGLDRVDGRLKVTGQATYSAEIPVAGIAHAVMVSATISRGRIAAIGTRDAEAVRGVIAVITHENALPLPGARLKLDPNQRVLQLLQDPEVHYDGQPIALVVAETLERAQYAASLVTVRYDERQANVEIDKGMADAYVPKATPGRPPPVSARGDVDSALASAAHRVDATYTTPIQNHNPMEPHATIAVWQGNDRVTLYDATQGIFGVKKIAALTFTIAPENVRVISHFLGGGFGCKGSSWSHVMLAALAARATKRAVKLVVTRPQMFLMVGYRPQTVQKLSIAADGEGTLVAARHDVHSITSRFDEFIEPSANITRMLYACPNVSTSHQLVRLDVSTPTFMRAPGESSGSFAIESAMDELSYAVGIDPLALRIKNHAAIDPDEGKPFSSKSLLQCYAAAAERFGWSRRLPTPRSMRDGQILVGWGMATATYPARQSAASAKAEIHADGTALVVAGSQDIGTGTYTVMTQVAADALGLPFESVRFDLGDTSFPEAPVSGGSQTVSSVGSAVRLASLAVRDRVIALAIAHPPSPLHGLSVAVIDAGDGHLFARRDPSRAESYVAILKRAGKDKVEEIFHEKERPERKTYSTHSFGVHFAEVRVDEDLATIRVSRWVGAFAAGKILNAKTARSQLLGGIVWGIGFALTEETVRDPRTGRVVTRDLADYHVPVSADVPDLDVITIPEEDPFVNDIGAKGIGEIGIVGAAAALANAVYHATGKRIRDLPITVDKLV